MNAQELNALYAEYDAAWKIYQSGAVHESEAARSLATMLNLLHRRLMALESHVPRLVYPVITPPSSAPFAVSRVSSDMPEGS